MIIKNQYESVQPRGDYHTAALFAGPCKHDCRRSQHLGFTTQSHKATTTNFFSFFPVAKLSPSSRLSTRCTYIFTLTSSIPKHAHKRIIITMIVKCVNSSYSKYLSNWKSQVHKTSAWTWTWKQNKGDNCTSSETPPTSPAILQQSSHVLSIRYTDFSCITGFLQCTFHYVIWIRSTTNILPI